ncbi:Histidine--tRNA ligase, cytoplasmic [Linum grandiflorum]
MADGVEVQVITLGGKGSSLSSSTVYAIAAGQARIRIDSSSLDRLSSTQSAQASSLKKSEIRFSDTSDSVESRSALVVLLNKLLRHPNPSKIRTVLPALIADTLNSGSSSLESVELNQEEELVVEKSFSELYGISAIVDHESASLSMIVDAVAALSCEALKGSDAAFNATDSGDGQVDKDEVGVASDIKVLLGGSKMVGKLQIEAVSGVPRIHGGLRQFVKSVHSMTRVKLNSSVNAVDCGEREAVAGKLQPFTALRNVGESSLCRAKLNIAAVGAETSRNGLLSQFERKCPTDNDLKTATKLVSDLLFDRDYTAFAHALNGLLGIVWNIVSWEAVTAFLALEGGELEGAKISEANVEDAPVNKRSEKKKKKAVLGRGTAVIVQLIKDMLQTPEDGQNVLEKWVEDLLMFFDHKRPQFDGLVSKVKELVESNESRRLPKLPKGTRDFSKEQMAIREKAFSIIADVFKRHGATALDTPVFELRETLMGKYGEDSKLVYDLADQGGELCSLRYDLTVPFARFVAMNGITSFKRYQMAKVYRRDNPAKGRYREFYQCDFDIAGQYEEMGPDFEIIKILTELLDELDIGDYEVKLNHRKLLDGMLQICGVPPEKIRTICSSIDKLDKQSFDQVKKEMVDEKGLSVATADKIGTFVKERGSPKELLSKLKQEGSEFLLNASSKSALDELDILFEALEKSKCIGKVSFDLSLARGLDYYTGVIYEAVFKGTTQVGSIAAGGRYDNLIGMFGTKQVPAVGVSLGIERVFAIMEQLQKDRNQVVRPTETQVLLSILGDKSKLPVAAELAGELWDSKVKAEYVVSTRFSKHIDRARDSKVPWMVLVGDKELERGIVKLKNIETTAEEEVPRATFVQELKRRLQE